jgi:hypothetical protein
MSVPVWHSLRFFGMIRCGLRRRLYVPLAGVAPPTGFEPVLPP